ncbi:MAG TPA: outer membrane protein assembly factor BamD [Bacteroidales bacterium]|nr:outer membrane protein assembly factor BamD [Bacteroidales bacterium]HOH22857.1 outer membrane protein assembly factor BamD [Bacteroidales bacterium]HPZ03982.1 outer membrane protein assembly factor BamD [Bacteroidales bacterium]HQB75599.1 outer membrane protein assembly factor BamD [Bacteroidales bacterium]
MIKNRVFLVKCLIFITLLMLCLAGFELKASNFSMEVLPISNYELGIPQDSVKKQETKKPRRGRFRSHKVSFETFHESYQRALRYYEKGAYLSAVQLFEQLYPLAVGTRQGDSILFLFADSYFKNKDYHLAAYHFKDYTRRYPGTGRTELAALNCVKALYSISPSYEVDQTDTYYAIDEIKDFIKQYPNSPYIEDCNTMLDELRNKLAQKQFEAVKLYYNTGHYRAAQLMVQDFMKEYSYSTYAPEALFLLVRNNYEYASKSVERKQKERFIECAEAYDALVAQFPDFVSLQEAKRIYDQALTEINKINSK